jgi:hypothetical protein
MSDKYPSISPYAYCAWNPIAMFDPDGCSGVPTKNRHTKTITITSKLYFYGPQATPELSRAIATGIASQWNGANATYTQKGEIYKVNFRIYYETVSEDRALELARNNTDKRNNFIRIDDDPSGASSRLIRDRNGQYGGNSFWFNTRDGLSGSTTPAHEYGHGLGLEHPNYDYSNTIDRPDIMIPRGKKYGPHWSIINGKGVRVVNPNSRRVTPQNVKDAINRGCGSVNNIILNEKRGKICE